MEQTDAGRGAARSFADDLEELRLTLETAPESILVETPQGRFLYANRDARDSIGVRSMEELASGDPALVDSIFEMRDEQGRPWTLQKLSAERERRAGDFTIVFHVRNRLDGSEHWRQVRSRTLRDAAGAPRLFVTTWHDLSQRRRVEEGLRLRAEAGRLLASSLDYQTTLDNLARLVVPVIADACLIDVIDEDGAIRRPAAAAATPEEERIIQALRRYPPLWGSQHPLLGTLQTGQPLLHGELPPPVRENLHAAARSPEHLELLLSIGFRSGLAVPLVARGQILGVLSLCMTSSGRRYTKDDLEVAEDLGRMAGLSLDNARLYLRAQRALQQRDDFLHVAAHELKTPLTSLRGFAQLALRQLQRGEGGPEDVARSLERVDSSSQKLGRLVGQLLDLSRLEAGRLKIERRPEDLAAIVRRAIADFRGREAHCAVELRGPEALPCRCDALRVEQVLLNLLDNAVKFSPEGSPVVVTLSAEGGGDRIAVQDRGVGIPPEHRARVFDRFYQAHADSYASGMGLGLHISHEIVELHGGRLTAEFPDEGGTRFVVWIPDGEPGPRGPSGGEDPAP